MNRSSPMLLAALFAALLGTLGLAPARAAGIPAGAAVAIDAQGKVETTQIRHHRHRVHRYHVRHRRHIYRPYHYRPAPVHYRRCVTQPRIVWTPYGYVRRWVRVCRY
jgi:hypothetical protein